MEGLASNLSLLVPPASLPRRLRPVAAPGGPCDVRFTCLCTPRRPKISACENPAHVAQGIEHSFPK